MATLTGMRTTAITLALATGITLFSPHIAHAATPPTSAEIHTTGAFLASQLDATTDGLLTGPTGRTDIGLTADVIFALDALNTHPEQADRSYTAVMANLDGFTHFLGEVDANRMAKIVALEDSRGERDSTRIAELVDAVQDNGQMMNETEGEPTSAVQNFGQSWSVIALARVGETAAAEKAASFLENQICPDGGVPLFQADPPSCNSVDPDTTGLAAQALTLVHGKDHPSTQATLGYLREKINASGGITGRFSGVNASTTTLAAGAFAAAADTANLTRTHSYLNSVRFGDTAPAVLRGAFAWRIQGMDATTTPTDQILRTSAQAALGFAGANYINAAVVYPGQDAPTPSPEPTPTPSPEPSPEPSAPATPDENTPQDATGSSEGGIPFEALAAVIALIAAVIGFAGPGFFLPVQV
ncbi:hypothetical protein [uncultured Corynebacterium sp.]|uniref:hypothetical protein n=1 Tax=uncultured Corynebacterium sp. TaxID=159447 RepID=UPI0025CE43E9|nr:hypothetical protein [uncultured Corynebacterium sp.]